MSVSRTKIAGYLIALVAVIKIVIDAINGGSFDISANWEELSGALGGLGLVFLRSGITKETSVPTAPK